MFFQMATTPAWFLLNRQTWHDAHDVIQLQMIQSWLARRVPLADSLCL